MVESYVAHMGESKRNRGEPMARRIAHPGGLQKARRIAFCPERIG
jgi:hypothetical protein